MSLNLNSHWLPYWIVQFQLSQETVSALKEGWEAVLQWTGWVVSAGRVGSLTSPCLLAPPFTSEAFA